MLKQYDAKENVYTLIDYIPRVRSQACPLLRTSTINGVTRYVLVIAGGISDTGRSVQFFDAFILPLESDLDKEEIILYGITNITNPLLNTRKYPVLAESVTVALEHGFLSTGGVMDNTDNTPKVYDTYWDFSDLLNSLFTAQSGESTQGLQVVAKDYSPGTIAEGADIYAYYGLNIRVSLGDFISNVLAQLTCYIGAFGMVVYLIEHFTPSICYCCCCCCPCLHLHT